LPGSSVTFMPGLVPPELYVTVAAANAAGAVIATAAAVARNDAIAHKCCFLERLNESSGSDGVTAEADPNRAPPFSSTAADDSVTILRPAAARRGRGGLRG
jgi:hypothetical protein